MILLLHTQELKDPHCRDEMAAARGALKKNATMLYTASQAFLRHPDVAATRANRDYVFKQVQEAIAGISNAAQATSPTDEAKGHTGIGELAAALNEFDVSTGVVLAGVFVYTERIYLREGGPQECTLLFLSKVFDNKIGYKICSSFLRI